jgi:uroporphyrinogen III methyltransferase/synthase
MSQPLARLRIVVTRAAHQADELAQPLAALGAEVVLLPVIAIAPPENPEPLAQAIGQIDSYDWIIFTSTNGVRALGQQNCRARIATVGAATREFAESNGWEVAVTPETYVAEALLGALNTEPLQGKRILIPTALVTRDVVREELTRRGATVEVVEAYRNVLPPDAAFQAETIFQVPYPDWITFASSSAVENLTDLVPLQRLQQSKIASIGPITSKTIRARGLNVTVEAQPHSVAGLVKAIML